MILLKLIDGNNASCDGCDSLFKRKPSLLSRSKRHWCSRPCMDSFMRMQNMIPCDHCKEVFYRTKSHASRSDVNFCSRKCNAEYHTGENHKAYDPDLNRACKGCGGHIEKSTSKRVYCSMSCYSDNNKGSDSSRYNKIVIKCSECSKDIKRSPSGISQTNFCSDLCKNSYHSERISGSSNPRYTEGHFVGSVSIKGVYEGFTLNKKIEIRERDNNECQICGTHERDHGMAMHVHHIDYDKKNSENDNLISLCRRCHSGKAHGKQKDKWQKILSGKLQS